MEFNTILQNIILTLPIFWLSLSVHEAAHAVTAYYCGDPTARDLGRITLNPFAHIDLFGTVLMPILGAFSGGLALVGWAKPVPVDPRNFRNWRRDDILVSVAGPASNIVLSIIFLIALVLFLHLPMASDGSELTKLFVKIMQYGMVINVALAVFNMIPIPPLDGSHVVSNLLPYELRQKYDQINAYGFIILLVFINVPFFRMMMSQVIGAVLTPYYIALDLLT